MNLPNRLTLLRMCLVPLFVACFYLDAVLPWWNVLAAVVFTIAALTDLFDGWYARRYGLVTDFGKLLDPMADKLLVCGAFIMLTGTGDIAPLLTFIFVGREFIISAFRLVAAENGTVIAAGRIGKSKTLLQCIAVVLILLDNPVFCRIGIPMDRIVLYAALALTIWSLVDYLYKNRKVVHRA